MKQDFLGDCTAQNRIYNASIGRIGQSLRGDGSNLGRLTVQELEQLVKAGRAPSQTALVEMLVAREEARLDLDSIALPH